MIMKNECSEVCREECEDKDKKVCMTIPHQVIGSLFIRAFQGLFFTWDQHYKTIFALIELL